MVHALAASIRRVLSPLAALGLAVSAFAADTPPAASPAPAADAPATPAAAPPARRPPFDPDAPAETQFKNIKVLKTIRAGELRDSMEFIEGALGAGCGFCHVRGAFDKDDKKPKDVARKMMRMVQEINTTNFDGKLQVTCYTCHQGSPKPVSVPAFDAPHVAADAFVKDAPKEEPQAPAGEAKPAPPAPALPTPDAVLDRFVEAIGGRAALAKLKALHVKATQPDEEHPASVEMTWQPPASMLSVLRSGEGDRAFVFTEGTDGTMAWGRRGDEPPMDLHGLRRATALHDAELLPAVVFAATRPKTEVLGTGKIGEQSVVTLSVGDASNRLYFDTTSGLLVRRAYEFATPLGSIPFQVDYSDWRDEGGVKLPHSMVTKQPGESATMTLDTIEPATGVTAATFAKPVAEAKP